MFCLFVSRPVRSLMGQSVGWSVGRLVGWLLRSFVGPSLVRLVDGLFGWLIDWLIVRRRVGESVYPVRESLNP